MRIFYGTVVNTSPDTPLSLNTDTVVGVGDDGKISLLESCVSIDELFDRYDIDVRDVYRIPIGQMLVPGLVDSHIHAPQFPNAGLGLGIPLLQWITKYTYPLEARFADPEFAQGATESVVRETLRQGTTTAAYYASIHLDASVKLADAAERLGQRAVVGKVAMDTNSPNYYSETTEESLRNTHQLIQYVQRKQCDHVIPSVIPRFALSCSRELMRGLGQLSRLYSIPVQTHVSESKAECELVERTFKECSNYVQVYDEMGLLHNKTVLGHGIHLNEKELAVIRDRGATISHCPLSNLSLRSGLCDVRKLRESGINVALGTDVSGGYDHSMLSAIRTALHVSTALSFQRGDSYKILDYREAFYMATLGGATALGLGDKTGSFEIGKDFDALLVDMSVPSGASTVSPQDDDAKNILEKFLFLGDDRNIQRVYVSGRQVLTQ